MSQHETRKPVGADLIIPVVAALYAIYYVWSVRDFPFEAQFSGLTLAALLGLLTLIYFVRVAVGFARGRYSLGSGLLLGPRSGRMARLAFVALIVAYILVIPYLGFTLTTFAFLTASFVVSGARPLWRPICVAAAASLVGWLFFIVLLETRFPEGPFERAAEALF